MVLQEPVVQVEAETVALQLKPLEMLVEMELPIPEAVAEPVATLATTLHLEAMEVMAEAESSSSVTQESILS